MANENVPMSFKIHNREVVALEKWPTSAALASKDGDILFLDSAGRADDAVGIVLGVQVGSIIDAVTGELDPATVAADDFVMVCTDPNVIMEAQISVGALTDPYTTRSSAACFDLAGNAGVQYINAGASTNDLFKVIGVGSERSGEKSAYGNYQKVLCQFNPLVHFRGPIA